MKQYQRLSSRWHNNRRHAYNSLILIHKYWWWVVFITVFQSLGMISVDKVWKTVTKVHNDRLMWPGGILELAKPTLAKSQWRPFINISNQYLSILCTNNFKYKQTGWFWTQIAHVLPKVFSGSKSETFLVSLH